MKSKFVRSTEILKKEGSYIFLSRFLNFLNRYLLFSLLFRNPFAWFGAITESLFNFDVYLWYLRKRFGKYVTLEINDYLMELELEDEGISRDLIRYRVREEKAKTCFEKLLGQLAQEKEEVTVLEIGANIGYYALLEASVLKDKGNIIAFEPSPLNIKHLEKNVVLNKFDDKIEVIPLGASSKNGTLEFEVSSSSNLSRVKDIHKNTEDVIEVIEVDVMRVDDYLPSEGISPEEVDVVRMDVEGYEYDVLKGMKSVIEASNPSLFFIELHYELLGQERKNQILEWMSKNGFEVVHSSRNFMDFDEDIDDLRSRKKGCPEVIFQKT